MIDVDGVRVVEVTMKPPSGEYLRWLVQNMDKIPPMDQPVIVPPDGAHPGHPHPDGHVGHIQPHEPSGTAKPSAPLPPDSPHSSADAASSTSAGNSGPVASGVAEGGHEALQGHVEPGEQVRSGLYSPSEGEARHGHFGAYGGHAATFAAGDPYENGAGDPYEDGGGGLYEDGDSGSSSRGRFDPSSGS
ncbi:hypothetical protein ACWEN6_16205 [Sphaerisporangium sp. NPDC004334]